MKTIKHLSHGGHKSVAEGTCFMEAVAYIAGEAHSDRPACVSPVIGMWGRSCNDGLPDDIRDRVLLPLVERAVGTVGSREEDEARHDAALAAVIALSEEGGEVDIPLPVGYHYGMLAGAPPRYIVCSFGTLEASKMALVAGLRAAIDVRPGGLDHVQRVLDATPEPAVEVAPCCGN